MTIWKIKSRISWEILFPPPTRAPTLQSRVQYGRNPARCQRVIVSGMSRKSASFQEDQNRRAAAQKSLSNKVESRFGMFAFQNRELLAQSEILQQQTSVGTKDAKDYSKQEPDEIEHGGQVIADGILAYLRKLLISKPDRNCGE